jgi:hypothetical protein
MEEFMSDDDCFFAFFDYYTGRRIEWLLDEIPDNIDRFSIKVTWFHNQPTWVLCTIKNGIWSFADSKNQANVLNVQHRNLVEEGYM